MCRSLALTPLLLQYLDLPFPVFNTPSDQIVVPMLPILVNINISKLWYFGRQNSILTYEVSQAHKCFLANLKLLLVPLLFSFQQSLIVLFYHFRLQFHLIQSIIEWVESICSLWCWIIGRKRLTNSSGDSPLALLDFLVGALGLVSAL